MFTPPPIETQAGEYESRVWNVSYSVTTRVFVGAWHVRSTQSPVLLLACHCRPDMVPDTGGVTMYETLVYMEYDVIVGYDDDDDVHWWWWQYTPYICS